MTVVLCVWQGWCLSGGGLVTSVVYVAGLVLEWWRSDDCSVVCMAGLVLEWWRSGAGVQQRCTPALAHALAALEALSRSHTPTWIGQVGHTPPLGLDIWVTHTNWGWTGGSHSPYWDWAGR